MNIEQVSSFNDAIKCNELLEKLIQSERAYNKNIKQEYKVKDWFENFFEEKNNAIFIAKVGENIVGYIYIQITSVPNGPMSEPEALVDGLYVEEIYRGQGVAKNLMNAAEEWAKKNNVKYLCVNVLEENSRAMKIYKNAGFNDFEKKLKKEL